MKRFSPPTLHTLFGFGLAIALYFAFLAFTNPNKLPIVMLVVPSILLGIVLYFAVRVLQITPVLRRRRLTAVVVAIYGSLLSLLASLQQLGWRDAILSGVLVWLFVFYFNRYKQ